MRSKFPDSLFTMADFRSHSALFTTDLSTAGAATTSHIRILLGNHVSIEEGRMIGRYRAADKGNQSQRIATSARIFPVLAVAEDGGRRVKGRRIRDSGTDRASVCQLLPVADPSRSRSGSSVFPYPQAVLPLWLLSRLEECCRRARMATASTRCLWR